MTEESKNLSELEFDQPLEEDVGLLPHKGKIYTEQADPEIESLYGKYKRGRLVLQPAFQRHFVWDPTKSSRLIESALLEIPLPVIYLSEQKDGREYVIDGQQRLTAFFSFIDGKFPNGRDFKLSGLKVFSELLGKKFKDITDELQDKIRYCKIRTITFKRDSEPDLKFEIFERLNTGSVSLNDQELRNCIYKGAYNELLIELSQDKDFMYLLGLKDIDKRMKDVELALRFAAFYNSTYLNFKPPMRSFLNKDMEKHQNISQESANKLRSAFKNSVAIIKSLLDIHAFKRFYIGTETRRNGYWEPKRFNASLYDILMWSFAKEDKNKVYQQLDSIREALIYLMTSDQEFIASIELSTSSVQAITKRFDKWRQTLQDIIGIAQREPRCFSFKLKKELYDKEPTCSICGQRIQNIDDGAIDHIDQYWTGGRTIPENARLTHRYCNNSRSRFDPPTSAERDRRGNTARIESGVRTPQSAYRIPILKTLVELGGRASVRDILPMVKNEMKNILQPIDYEYLANGREMRWQNTAAFERNQMKIEGLLSPNSPRGIWEITNLGRKYLEKNG